MISTVRSVTLAMSLLAAAVACTGGGGNPDRVLQLSTGTFSELELRTGLQETIAEQGELYEVLCAALGGLSDGQAFEVVMFNYSLSNPQLELVVQDEERFLQILREECEDAY